VTHPEGGGVARVLRAARGGHLEDAAALARLPGRSAAAGARSSLLARGGRSHHGVALGAQHGQLRRAQPRLKHHEALRLEAAAQHAQRRPRAATRHLVMAAQQNAPGGGTGA
jgi:hypothetical protein